MLCKCKVVVTTSTLGKNIENLFMSETQCPTVLRQFYDNSETELWISFTQSKASLFHETIKVIDGDDKCGAESTLTVKTLLLKLRTW
jgi:hypothetical protein